MKIKNLEYYAQNKIQDKWKAGQILGHDCLVFASGKIVMAQVLSEENPNDGCLKHFWVPLCDTELEKIEIYNEDIWTCYDIFHGSLELEEQRIVFGDGAMGNEGFIASTTKDGSLSWSLFFTFSNPIVKAEIHSNKLVCHGDTGMRITIDLNELTHIEIG